MHGLNEGHIAPYTDVAFQLTKYKTYIIMKSWYKSLQDIWRNYYTIDKDKTCKTDGIKTIFTTGKNQGCIIKRRNKNTTLRCTWKIEQNNISNTVKSIITSSKDNALQALWLMPAPPARTPNHHNQNAINKYKQKSSSHDSYGLL